MGGSLDSQFNAIIVVSDGMKISLSKTKIFGSTEQRYAGNGRSWEQEANILLVDD